MKAEKCDFCKLSLKNAPFVDGRTKYGPWANMCLVCAAVHGVGLGIGCGQMYDKDGVQVAGGTQAKRGDV